MIRPVKVDPFKTAYIRDATVMTSATDMTRDRGITRLLIANRGEVAIRIARSAAELGIQTVAVYSADDAQSLHMRAADEVRALPGVGAAAYCDIEQLVAIARAADCDAVHPGYGFLSERAAFARRCAQERLRFVGPQPQTLELFGDKAAARALASRCGVPVLSSTAGPTSREKAPGVFASLGPLRPVLSQD